MDYQNILYGKDAPVLTITLNSPAALNAISPALEQELHAALDEADADPEIRAIIVTGAGRALSALAHTSHLPMRDELCAAMRAGGMRTLREKRDGPFHPESFGPQPCMWPQML